MLWVQSVSQSINQSSQIKSSVRCETRLNEGQFLMTRKGVAWSGVEWSGALWKWAGIKDGTGLKRRVCM